MKKATPTLFLIAAVLFFLVGAVGLQDGQMTKALLGLGLGSFWLLLGVSLKRKQGVN